MGNRFLLVAGFVVVTIFGLGSISQAENNEVGGVSGTQLTVCVDWDSKEVRYSKHWEECPAKHAEINLGIQGPKGEQGEDGPRGPRGYSGGTGASGSTTSLWDSLSTCHQKIESAMSAGLYLATQSDRSFFEAASGCTVEDSIDQTIIQNYKRAGVPVVESVDFVSVTDPTEGEGFYAAGGPIVYDVRIANYLAISSYGSSYQYCFGTRDRVNVEQITGNQYRVTATYSANLSGLTSTIKLGIRENNYSDCFYGSQMLPDIIIQEDPNRFSGLPGMADLLTAWGW